MSVNEVHFTTEIIKETYKFKWKITKFNDLLENLNLQDTLFIEVVTGKAANLESKWIIGFKKPAPGYSIYSISPVVHPLLYCKLVQLPSSLIKVGVNFRFPDDDPRYGGEYHPHQQDCQSLMLNEQIEAQYSACRGIPLDHEGSLELNLELTVKMPKSVQSKPPQCLPD